MSAMRTTRAIALASILATAVVVAGCGGAQSRLASHMKRGQDYLQRGDYAKAGVEFRNAMQIAPKDVEARVMAAEVQQKLGQLRGAYNLLQSVIEEHPDNIEARISLARLLVTAGSADQALQTIKPALDKQPANASLLALRAAAKSALKDPAGARTDADRALAIDPQNEDAIELRAGLYRQDGDFAAAIKLVSAATNLQPTVPGFHIVLVSLYEANNQPAMAEDQLRALVRLKPDQLNYRAQLAVFLSRSKRLDDAQKVLNEAVKALPADDEAKLLLVNFLAQQRSPGEAEQALRQFIQADSGNYNLQLALGALLQRLNQTDKAIVVYNDIVKGSGTETSGLIARVRLAAIAKGEKRDADAQRLLAEVLKVSPRDSDALAIRGEMALQRGDSTGAIADLRAVLRDQPRSVAVNKLLAQALVAHGDRALAEEPLRTAVDAAPKDGTLRVALAQLLFQQQKPDQGLQVLLDAAKALPGDEGVNVALVHTYIDQKDLSAAAAAADAFLKAKPDGADAYLLSSQVARADNRLGDAQSLLEKALALQPRGYDVLSDLVHLQTARGMGAQAVSRLQTMLQATPKDALLANLLAEVYLQQRNFSSAQQYASQAMTDQSKWWMPYRNLALAKVGSGDLAGAVAAYQDGLKVAPNEPMMLADLGALYQQSGKLDDAIKLYQGWVGRDPRSQVAANNLAMLLVNNRTDKASLDQAQTLTAGFASAANGDLLDTAGWVQFKRGDYNQAIPVLQHAAELLPDSHEVHYHLGMAELRAGQTDRARSDLEAALAGSRQFSGADDARAALAALKNRAG
jgi:tetratricopeptide (TPR) repeat protein